MEKYFKGFKLTREQYRVKKGVYTGENTSIQSPAGSGKTTILEACAEEMAHRKGLYVAFNRAIAQSASKKFHPSVESRTVHSLGFGGIGWKYKERLSKVTGTLVANAVDLGDISKFPTPASKGYLVLDTLNRFCYSADKQINTNHTPEIKGPFKEEDMPEIIRDITKSAKALWELMIDEKSTFPITHDFYLKLWGLSKPHIKKDYILLDEGQDANPVMVDILTSQKDAQLVVVGDKFQQIYCQPEGTMVGIPSGYRAIQTNQVPIEEITKGTKVITYWNSHVYKRGREVSHITKLKYNGELIVASTEKEKSRYIPKHQCIVRVGKELENKHIVYLMKKGTNYRIGKTPYFYKTQGSAFGLGLRSAVEGADASWILSIHGTNGEALMYEALYQTKYSIPSMRFRPGDRDVINTNLFWKLLGSNAAKGLLCLQDFKLLKNFPMWTSGHNNLIGVRRPFVTAASNLHTGLKMLPLGNEIKYKGKRHYNAPKQVWEPIKISTETYNGYVYSLEVEDHHTYYADGLLTHNSWRGAMNAMENVHTKHRLHMTQSFRFGKEIAELANNVLGSYRSPDEFIPKIRGFKGRDSRVSMSRILTIPDCIICRTNNGVISNVFEHIDKRPVYIQGGPGQMISLLMGAKDLMNGKKTYTSDLALFKTWQEVLECSETESGRDLKSLVNMIKEYGIPKLINALYATSKSAEEAELTITTAHKAKGLEWGHVKLHDDFQTPSEGKRMHPAEANVLYVALTRALILLDASGCTACHPETLYDAAINNHR